MVEGVWAGWGGVVLGWMGCGGASFSDGIHLQNLPLLPRNPCSLAAMNKRLAAFLEAYWRAFEAARLQLPHPSAWVDVDHKYEHNDYLFTLLARHLGS